MYRTIGANWIVVQPVKTMGGQEHMHGPPYRVHATKGLICLCRFISWESGNIVEDNVLFCRLLLSLL